MSLPTPVAALLGGLALWAALAAPQLRALLEARLAAHVLVQLPTLALAGYLVGVALRRPLARQLDLWNAHGATGLLTALPIAACWMLPRSIDAALASSAVESVKLTSVPLLVGLPLALSRPRIGPVLGGFLKANAVSMALVLGWLYLATPQRLCSSYLIDDQTLLGKSWLLIALALGLIWGLQVLVGRRLGPGRRHPPGRCP